MVSLPPHLQARPAARRESSPADKAIDGLLARRPAPAPRVASEATSEKVPRNLEESAARLRSRIEGRSLEQLLATYTGRGSLLDVLV